MVNREEFLGKLELVAPALSDNELLQVLTHFWLTGSQLMAFNDQIAISTPFASDVQGAVSGKVLLSLVKLSRAKDADLSVDGTTLLLKMASTKSKLALLPPDNFVFEMPAKGNDVIPFKDKKEFLATLEMTMISVGKDSSITDQLGVTLIPGARKLNIYSTNNTTLCHAVVDLSDNAPFDKRIILPASFCERVISIAGKRKNWELEIRDDHALFSAANVRIFGRLIVSERPVDFDAIIKKHTANGILAHAVPMPTRLEMILERAVVITDTRLEQAVTKVTCKENMLKFVSQTERGEVVDQLPVNAHPDVSVAFEPRLLREGYKVFDNMLFTERAVILTKGNALYLVSGLKQ